LHTFTVKSISLCTGTLFGLSEQRTKPIYQATAALDHRKKEIPTYDKVLALQAFVSMKSDLLYLLV